MQLRPCVTGCVASSLSIAASLAFQACVPGGSGEPYDAGPPPKPAINRTPAGSAAPPAAASVAAAPADLLRSPFEDDFEHGVTVPLAVVGGEGTEPDAAKTIVEPRPADWAATVPGIWHIEGGRLCGERAHNHGIWLKHALPTNARIEFDAVSMSADGDLKAEFWGDGRSAATAISYTNATSYLTIFGGWRNKLHVLARINEHGGDRKEITVDPNSDDPREHPVMVAQLYHFKVERADGRTVRWWVDGNEMLTFADMSPLTGAGHEHFGFNDWEAKVCFDNVRVVPLP